MDRARPDPDALLKQITLEEPRSDRGRLKVFLGAAAGVGKTYAMLSQAHEQCERGIDVAIGYVETHGRKETEALVQGLPVIPLRMVHYRGAVIKEFDVDATLRRKPTLVLVDELPHTNAPESRHARRWQDIEELLDAGINVYTACNIQHIESLRDVVAQITGIQVRETVPDAFLERTDEIELIDIPPDELRQRLQEGKIYVPEKVEQALEGFFKKGNLLALRELALRRTADRVETDMAPFRQAGSGVWATRERVLICIGPNSLGDRVVRAAARIGVAAHAKLYALVVESDRQRSQSAVYQPHLESAFRLAEQLGAETGRRVGHDIVAEILDFANKNNITLIVVGKPVKPRWKEIVFGSVVDELVRRSGAIDVHVVTGDQSPVRQQLPAPQNVWRPPTLADVISAVGATAVTTGLGLLMFGHLPLDNVMALYLLTIAIVASRMGARATALCCLLCVGAFDYFFVEPRFSFQVSDVRFLPTFAVMLLVAALIGRLTLRLRYQAAEATKRERRTAALFDLSRELSKSRRKQEIAEVGARRLKEDFEADAAVLLPDAEGRLRTAVPSRCQFEQNYKESPVAQWVYEHGSAAGHSTDTLRGSIGLYLPLISGQRTLGVLGLKALVECTELDPAQRPLLETCASAMAVALERSELAKESHEARLAAEAEKIRSSLLSSVSHDIRSPLTAIAGAASALMDVPLGEGEANVRELGQTIYDESQRLNRHVRNLLDMTRLESGTVEPKLDWNAVEEIVGGALNRVSSQLADRPVSTDVQDGLPLLRVDGSLIEQALVNFLENAIRHTSPGTPIAIVAAKRRSAVRIEVQDRGPGVSAELRQHLFEKFSQERGDQNGFGLGLAIASAIVKVHKGEIGAEDRVGGGMTFFMEIPIGQAPPEVPQESAAPQAKSEVRIG